MPYLPSKPPPTSSDDGTALAFYLEDELSRLAMSLLDDVQAVEIRPAHAAPLRPREGMLVYADGTDWNPGSGEGLYTFGSDTTWHFVTNLPVPLSVANGGTGQTTPPACFAANKNAAAQTGIADSTFTQVTFDNEIYDVGSFFAASAWTPPAGKVHLDTSVYVSGTVSEGNQIAVAIYKNGASLKQGNSSASAVIQSGGVSVSADDIANGTDVYTVRVYIDVNSGTGTVTNFPLSTFFNGHWFSA